VLLADLEAADARVVLLAAARRAWALARANVERTQQSVLEATRALAPLASALAAAESAVRQAGSEVVRASAASAAACAEATVALAAWPTPLKLDDVSAALARVQAATTEWRQAEKTHAELSARLPGLDEAVRTAGVELEAARAAQAELEAERSRLAGRRGALMAERAGVIEGRAADEVERGLQTAVDVATAAAGDALTRRAAALARSASAAAEAELARGLARRAAEEAREAGARLDHRLAGLAWTREELESNFMDHAAREHARRAVHQASEALRLAEAAHDIAAAEVMALVLPPGFDPSTLEERAAAADVAIGLADDARSGALTDVTRRRDEGARQRVALAEKLRLEAAAKPWSRLRDLIGGDSFRRLAQSRSIDALVELANQQLAVFARRYTLQRHEDADMDLQVCDEESGDEVRGTESLSGGETFLVSLALALALGRLSSRSVNVQTLFIDEGFGALDSESVEPVIDALRKISAGGTQIGVISHVPVIAERVDALVTVQKQSETSHLRITRV
jgi:exonuclease SbcC